MPEAIGAHVVPLKRNSVPASPVTYRSACPGPQMLVSTDELPVASALQRPSSRR